MIGRKREQQILDTCLQSPRPEFLAVYGRRRIGKTYLIREYFHDRFAFYATGVHGEKTRQQLKAFRDSLSRYSGKDQKIPADWFEAFARLREILEEVNSVRDPVSGKKVVFLDELPWMDTARSDFKAALDYFWNSWGSAQKDLLLIVCGSATSWIIDHLLADTGGFYNRVTRQMHMKPFTLAECEALLHENQIDLPRKQILQCYMVFGGVPQYLNSLDRRLSLDQNIEQLCSSETGDLRYEYERLYRSLFRNADRHIAIIDQLSRSTGGTLRTELALNPKIGDGESLTKALMELEQCGFIRRYQNIAREKQGFFYQIIDPFTLFSLRFLRNSQLSSWMEFIGTPAYYNWCGNAFEMLCLNHVPQIKQVLGIPSVETKEYSWRSRQKKDGAQIDLIIDRKDQLINLCEMKFTREPFVIDAAYEKQLIHKLELFRQETTTDKAVHITMVSAAGLMRNQYAGSVQSAISGDELFV